jgi:hypothetical protein
MPPISIPTIAYPTLCKKRKGWGTRLFVVLPAVPSTNRGLIENVFLIRKPHEVLCATNLDRKSGGAQWRDLQFSQPAPALDGNSTLPFVIPTAVEGPAVSPLPHPV